eukprot:TRINITY_DN10391_c0_g1::TRINITY_DN10391_c0_g1_i1::g.9260::m.9260 TRINITY_DN10391_c0_g1::TRINITY_DN10391_c0_g1_i1::g.9260  ORF type:complete len:378 (+),score=66.19,sp/Q24317/PRI1_DROME/44.05/2e-88,DNA_primase_S/PF01896.14/5.2e-45 TRINITY_DN10391_c0_g1_i1:102-1235(+)
MGEQVGSMVLRNYYANYFPFESFTKWLCYGQTSRLEKREISFTLEGDIYQRYLSFTSPADLRSKMVSSDPGARNTPIKIDIGAIYNVPPKDRTCYPRFIPTEHELVFDIDMTDYDPVRTCCSDANICAKCWRYLSLAAVVLDKGLRDDFGFDHIMWVFSGRRGIHGWVCDQAARKLTDRSSLAEYFHVLTGGRVELTNPLHPSLDRAKKIIEERIMDILQEQELLTEQHCQRVLNLVEHTDVREKIKTYGCSSKSFETKWQGIQNAYKARQITMYHQLLFSLAYPRLDINVTRGMNHLLKAPFCVHPKTGLVCVPLSLHNIEHFNPTVHPPNIMHLCGNAGADKDQAMSSMEEYIDAFKQFVDETVADEVKPPDYTF